MLSARTRGAVLRPDATLADAFRTLEQSDAKIVLVVDDEDRLLGTVTDGDARRGLLKNLGLDATMAEVMNRRPATARAADSHAKRLDAMRRGGFRHLPIVGEDGRLVDLVILADLARPPERDETVVLMAGGEGRRLRPLTETIPKPLLPVGDRPILETIIERFAEQGFRRFVLSVHYRAEAIIARIGDGAALGVDVTYVHETEPRGTAGALALLPERPRGRLIVMNGDILTRVDFGRLLEFHADHAAAATACVREFDIRVPYGVVETDGHRMTAIVEKPLKRFLVSAGIYALDPAALDLVPADRPMDMPTLLTELGEAGREVAAFPIREYWIDIGHLDDLERARDEYGAAFGAVPGTAPR